MWLCGDILFRFPLQPYSIVIIGSIWGFGFWVKSHMRLKCAGELSISTPSLEYQIIRDNDLQKLRTSRCRSQGNNGLFKASLMAGLFWLNDWLFIPLKTFKRRTTVPLVLLRLCTTLISPQKPFVLLKTSVRL